jgi:DNA replication protein DnaC
LSYVRCGQAESSVLLELIAERYKRKSVAITANALFMAWVRSFRREQSLTVATLTTKVEKVIIK